MNVRLRPLLLALTITLAACQRAPRNDCGDGAAVIDPELLAFLSRARSAHHMADQHEATEPSAALRALDAFARGPRPNGSAPEVLEVLSDTRARLADLRSRAGDFDGASRDAQLGLELAQTPNYFRGHLLEVQGLVEERRGQALRQQGQLEEAEAARIRSLSAYEQAMQLQAQVIEKAAPEAPPAKSAP